MAFPHRPDAPELPDFSMLKRLARDQLIYLLEQLPGKKDLFIEADLMSPLDRIANVSILKQHEVDKLYKVESKPAVSSSEQLCFLVRPRIKNMRYIANLVNADKLAGRTRKYKVIFSPQKSSPPWLIPAYFEKPFLTQKRNRRAHFTRPQL
uniref:VPS33B late endosome and lysosome associated n=1 Tax=Equus caballus TaxID=9796 RepID=A0A9L0R4K1_HORSE